MESRPATFSLTADGQARENSPIGLIGLQSMGTKRQRRIIAPERILNLLIFIYDDKFFANSFLHNDENFPFRYASGGTLPILRMEGQGYYCFFYRDIFPIGWNIANGGCCTREELLNPQMTIERELYRLFYLSILHQAISDTFWTRCRKP